MAVMLGTLSCSRLGGNVSMGVHSDCKTLAQYIECTTNAKQDAGPKPPKCSDGARL